MKLERDDGLAVKDFLHQPPECSLRALQQAEIVGQMENRSLQAIRRLWWRACDRMCYCLVFIRLSIHDRIFGPEPPTPAELNREADH